MSHNSPSQSNAATAGEQPPNGPGPPLCGQVLEDLARDLERSKDDYESRIVSRVIN